HESERWEQHRAERLRSFSGINVDIGRVINETSRAAVGSRGNDIKVLASLVTEVCRERDSLKAMAQGCRTSTDSVHGSAGMAAEQVEGVNGAGRAFEFELEQMPEARSISYYLVLSLLPAAIPFLALAFSDAWRMAVYLTLALTLPVLVILAAALAII